MKYKVGETVSFQNGSRATTGDIVQVWKLLWWKQYRVHYSERAEFSLEYDEKLTLYTDRTKWIREKDIICQVLTRSNVSLNI
jgi:hypothetical protein